MDASELLKRYAAGERDFRRFDLRNTDFSNISLNDVDLRDAILSGSIFFETNLRGANLSGVDLSEVEIHSVNLSYATLYGLDLHWRHLENINFRGADLYGSCFADSNFYNVKLKAAQIINTSFTGSKLFDCDLSKANLSNASFDLTIFENTSLELANLDNANFSYASLKYVNLSNANLTNADFSKANISHSNLSKAKLAYVKFNGADLTNVKLDGANLIDIDLSGAKLDGTILFYQKVSEELLKENQILKEKISVLETHFENLVEKYVYRKLIANQGIKAKNKLTWEGLRFRSEAEKKIAQVLDEMGVLFFPLPSGRVMTEEGMKTREVDFLICSRGIWGILECDGEMWHLSAAKDHKRDNDYKRHGLWFIQRFTSNECKKNPHNVINQFLDMLHKFHEDQRYLITGNSAEIESSLPPINHSTQSEDSSFQSNTILSELSTNIIADEGVNLFSEKKVALGNADIKTRLGYTEDEDVDLIF